MRYDQIDALLAAESTSLERRRVIAAEDQDPLVGIIDDTTDCDKDYWERDYGPFNALVALYDAVAGRTTQGSLDLLGVLAIGSSRIDSDVTFGAPKVEVGTGGLTVPSLAPETDLGDLAKTDLMTVTEYRMASGATGLTMTEDYVTAHLGAVGYFIRNYLGHMEFYRPWSQSEYNTHGSGGGFKFVQGSTARAFITPTGKIVSGGQSFDNYTSPPGFTAYNNAFTSSIDFINYIASSHPGGSSEVFFGIDDNKSPTAPNRHGFKITANLATSSLSDIDIIIDDTVIATLNATSSVFTNINGGTLSSSGIITSSSFVSFATNNIATKPVPAGVGSSIYDILGVNKLFATTQIKSIDTNMSASLNTTSSVAHIDLINSAGADFGLAQTSVAGDYPVIFSTGSDKKIYVIGGLRDTVSNEVSLVFPEFAAGKKSSISLETGKYIFTKDGVVKVANKSADLGGTTLGYHAIPIDFTGVDFAAGTSTVDAGCSAISQPVDGAIVGMKHTGSGRINLMAYNGANWENLTKGIGLVDDVAASTYALDSDASILHVSYTATGPCTITLNDSETYKDRVVIVNDGGASAGTNNITINTELTANIDGASSATISVNTGSLRLYCDGTNWFTF